MNLLVFGSSSFCANSFNYDVIESNIFKRKDIYLLSRSNSNSEFIDLNDVNSLTLDLLKKETVIVSFAPIWLLSIFLNKLSLKETNYFRNIKFLISTSSTSALTKKYAFCKFDKKLSSQLIYSENQLVAICKKYNISLEIVRTSLIYGGSEKKQDKNIQKLADILKFLPIVFVPKETGLRQPIHTSQLSSYYIKVLKEYKNLKTRKKSIKVINIGGDESLSFFEMLLRIRNINKNNNFFSRCIILKVPNRIFNIALFPVYIFSPKIYESILRISVDLASFEPAFKLLGTKPIRFPLNN